ncbi:MAG: PQQ-dependent sugar dehydrogenase [Bosea sp. (in: a-proteobacteria)]
MLDFVAGRGNYSQRIIGVHDLLKLRSGAYAFTLSKWDDAGKCVLFEVATVDLRERSPKPATLFVSTPCLSLNLEGKLLAGHQAGGRLAEPRDGVILVTVGDFARDGVVSEPAFSQDSAASYGKLIEIRVADGAHRIFASGLRNPQGLALTGDGRIFETEHGPQGGDELNDLVEGGDYGWPRVTYGTDYDRDYWPPSPHTGRHDGYRKPSYAWLPSVGVSQLVEVAGFAPEWNGDLLVGALATNNLWRLRLEGDHVVYAEQIPIKERVRDIVRLSSGQMAVLSDTGRIVLIAAAPKSSRPQPAPRMITQLCLECHTIARTPNTGGRISLSGLLGRDIASWPGATYSPALSAVEGKWNRDRLRDYLRDPQAFAPGTTMPAGIADPAVLEEVLGGLEALSAPEE